MAFKFSALAAAPAQKPAFKIETVEDILEGIMTLAYDPAMQMALMNDTWANRFVNSVYEWVNYSQRALTTDQAKVLLRFLERCKHVLITNGLTTADDV